MAKVIHVHLTRPVSRTRQRDWYFGSISAVYSVFTPEEVGVDILNKLTPYKLFKLTPIDNLCFWVGICRS